MQIYIRVKTVGKHTGRFASTPYCLPDSICSLRQLLTAVVELEVDRYNHKEPGAQQIPYLSADQIEAQAQTGKVSFGRIFSDRKVCREDAVQHAIQCWEDGLVRVFLGDVELRELDGSLTLQDGAQLTFLRFTFLAGRIW